MPRPFRMTRSSRRSAFLIVTALGIAGLVLAGFQLAAPARAAGPAQVSTVAHVAGSGALAAAGPGPARPAAAIAPAISCTAVAAQNFATAVPGAPTQITSAAVTTYNGASFCDVQGVQAPQLQFDLKLPVSTWTGRYVQAGCGGYCGAVGSVAPQAATGCPKVTGNELALATDNEGHTGSGFNALFGYDPGLRVSYAYSSEHNLALAAKAIIKAYYGQGPGYSYFDGCSDGGREALVEAERYPADFNGILAGAPEIYASELNGEVQAWNVLVNMDSGGHEVLAAGKLPALHAAVEAACANAQGYIADPRTCSFDPKSIQCPAGTDNSSCLTPAQVAVVVKLYQGPRDPQGGNLYPGGEPYGSELAWTPWFVTPSTDASWPADTIDYGAATGMLEDLAFWVNPPASFKLTDWKFTLQNYRRLTALNGLNDSTDPNLSAFARAGGKIIIWHGFADSAINPFGTVNYYKAVVQDAGGFAASQRFSRLYMVPGGYHCLGGGAPQVTADLLDPLISWVENGAAPGPQTFPLTSPTATLTSITSSPLNPLTAVHAGGTALNLSYQWVGQLLHGNELWCDVNGMEVACRTRPGR
jgi:Tannase and feruloyl esterase